VANIKHCGHIAASYWGWRNPFFALAPFVFSVIKYALSANIARKLYESNGVWGILWHPDRVSLAWLDLLVVLWMTHQRSLMSVAEIAAKSFYVMNTWLNRRNSEVCSRSIVDALPQYFLEGMRKNTTSQ